MKTGIKVSKQVLTRQLAPYTTNCSDQYPPGIADHSPLDLSNTNYSQSYCKTICLVKYVKKVCHCLDPNLLEANFLDQVKPNDLTFCSLIKNSTQRTCSIEAVKNYSLVDGISRENCPCQPNCYEESYEVSTKYQIVFELCCVKFCLANKRLTLCHQAPIFDVLNLWCAWSWAEFHVIGFVWKLVFFPLITQCWDHS